MLDYQYCKLCPRECGVNRIAGELGFCGGPDRAVVSHTMLHKWEEPCLAGAGGSGAVFFGGCTLRCRYCQNAPISHTPKGKLLDSKALRELFLTLIGQGAENIDLVTPTQYLPTLIPALSPKLPVPVVYNCGGYEKVQTLQKLQGLVDIYLPDMKYGDNALAQSLSGAGDYVERAREALFEMVRQVGPPQWDGERLTKGVVVRHLILPGQVENSLKVLDFLGESFAPGEILVSLMRQYTPMPGLESPYNRPIREEEYQSVLSWMYLNRLEGFTQEKGASDTAYIPDFA